jgi:5-dehydro-2-deoxygluconokinase
MSTATIAEEPLDVVAIGRCSVDLYGQQIGGRLEDMASFAKSVGGCPANIAIGAARLGLRAALVSRVGDEAMGRFVREQLAREGVDVRALRTDPERLTALVVLGVRSEREFPLIFYRENCADAALDESDIDAAMIRRAKAVVVTGTHFSIPAAAAAQRKAMRLARAAGARVVLDIDYRPNLWGLLGHGAGDNRFVASAAVTARLQSVLPECDVVVGTEEEIAAAGGAGDPVAALRAVRALTPALIVMKRGPMGCALYPGPIPDRVEDGVAGAGFPVEVYNVLGAGDAFMAGLLRGLLRGESLETAATYANACGAFAVSRLLCSPESPTFAELSHFLKHGSTHHALRRDPTLTHIHRTTTRRRQPARLMALAIDHRAQLEEMAERLGADRALIPPFKRLAVAAAVEVAAGRPGFGVLCDMKYGREALVDASRHDLWIGRPIEEPGSRPLRFEPDVARVRDLGGALAEWPVGQTVKCLAFMHPDDPPDLMAEQEERLIQASEAARAAGRELLVEIIAGRHGPLRQDTVAGLMARLYALGIRPDWWKLEPQTDPAAWALVGDVIAAKDPACRGVVLLGLGAGESELLDAFAAVRAAPIVRGFAVGRTVIAAAAEGWLAGRMDADAARADMAARFARLAEAWLAHDRPAADAG